MNGRLRRPIYALDPWLLPPVVWGSTQLQRSFGKDAPPDAKLGESWEVSCVAGRESTLRGEGVSLGAAFAAEPTHFLGTASRAGAPFPLLVKLLATSTYLSVQVHPNDAQAARLENSPAGKHEAWVVLSAAPGAEVCGGLKPGATADDLFDAARAGDTDRVRGALAMHRVGPGDVVEVPPGCVHAPGPGLVLYEVQQPVDLTYRIYDWGRTGLDGKPRPLHVDRAREVLDPAVAPRILRAPAARGQPGFSQEPLVATRSFRLARWRVDGEHRAAAGDLMLFTCVDGRGTASAGGERVAFARGQSGVVPAATPEVVIRGEGLELLVASRG